MDRLEKIAAEAAEKIAADAVEQATVAAPEPTVFSVEQLNKMIRGTLESKFDVVWVRGELSNFKAHTSGHFYFSLKDSQAQVSAVMFRGSNGRLKFKPHDGLEVIIRGKVTVYEQRGNYQIVCDMMEPVGAGALQKAFEQLKEKLKKEGLFETSKKRPIPHLPKHVAIVTSPTGAAIRDILNVLARRARNLEITIVPTIVQGAEAAPLILQAFQKAVRLPGVDVVIIGRGGGSIEDMWCFNDEALARAIAASPVPVISAIGHEIDFTIADFVSDLRAPTPSAAAELVVKNVDELNQKIESQKRLLKNSMVRILSLRKERLVGFSKRLVDPKRRLQELILRNDDLLTRLQNSLVRNIETKKVNFGVVQNKVMGALQKSLDFSRNRLNQNMAVLDSISPLKVVARGYSMVFKNEKLLSAATALKAGDTLQVQFAKGAVEVEVKKVIDDLDLQAKEEMTWTSKKN